MNTTFFNFVDRVVKLCCQKKTITDKAPECEIATGGGFQVLAITEKDDQEINTQDK